MNTTDHQCPDCNSDIAITEIGGITRIAIAHDPTCPTYAELERLHQLRQIVVRVPDWLQRSPG